MTTDVIDQLVGAREGDRLFELRTQRQGAKKNAQAAFDALFSADDLAHANQRERLAIAYWTVALSHSPTAAFYRGLLAREDATVLELLETALPTALTTGPYGDYPDGPLTVENVDGLHWQPDADLTESLGARLATALAHAHLLVYRPRDSSADALQALLDAGWSTTGVVTLSQIIGFLSFQLRVVAGLTVLKGEVA